MSKIIEHFLIPLFVVVSVLYAFNSFGRDDIIQLNKVYHHTTHNPSLLEKANVCLYFSGEPHVQEIKNKQTQNAQGCTFFFPNVSISSGECEEMVQRLCNYKDCYRINVQEVTMPTKGIMVTFAMDPHKFVISYEQFDSIGLQKGVVFHVYNKELLHNLEQANNKPVLRTLWHMNNNPRIVIDPGHGGVDAGAIGYGGIEEKQVCLAIGKEVGNLLEQHGCSVVLTRNNDYTISLDARTLCANDYNADLFVSIHANYASNSRVCGVETFCLQPSLLKKRYSQLTDNQDNIIADVAKQRAEYSDILAQSVQQHVCNAVSEFHDQSIDRKVKHSVTQVLLGTQAPSVLVEVGFVSNQKEAGLLNNDKYQKCIAHAICNGILSVRSF